MLWMPVREGFATLSEVHHDWTLDDVCEAHMMKVIQDIADARAAQYKPRGGRHAS